MTIQPASLSMTAPPETAVGDLLAEALADAGVTTLFGVISIHNMPILDAVLRQGRIRFVPARGEAGAMNMADAYARVSKGLGVVLTSTGTAAGNAAGAQVEALTAGSPVLHITTTVDTQFMDRDRAAIHDVPRQPDMLKAISKAYFRVWEARGALATLHAAMSAALSAPTGPVSLEIPVDVQRGLAPRPLVAGGPTLAVLTPDPARLDVIADLVLRARRPLLFVGGGARGAAAAATELVRRGFAGVTSTNGRAVIPEDHPHSLGAFNMTPEAQAIYDAADLVLVVGTRLRGNETRNNLMRLPRPFLQVDAEATQGGRNYPVDLFLHADAGLALDGLLARLPERLDTDAGFLASVATARAKGEAALLSQLGPYETVAKVMRDRVFRDARPFIRDVTISNSTFGNRFVSLAAPNLGVHALGGGIGQGVAMAIGGSIAGGQVKSVGLAGDGGTQLNLGELATLAEENCNLVLVLMNDCAYGVISNIQDAQYEGRRAFCRLRTPDFGLLCQSIGLSHHKISRIEDFEPAFDAALARPGPIVLEVDMIAIGPFAQPFGGPPAGAAGGAR